MSTRHKTVTLPSEPAEDFAKRLRPGSLAGTLNLPLCMGQDAGDARPIQFPGGGVLPVDFGKMCNLPEGLATGPEGRGPCAYAGDTPEGTPVQVGLVHNLAALDPAQKASVRATVDIQALAEAYDAERGRFRADRGLPQAGSGAIGRVSVALRQPCAAGGFPGVSRGSVRKCVSMAAAQNYLVNSSKADPGRGVPSKDDVAAVADLLAKEYRAFAEAYADKDCPGIRPRGSGGNGPFIEGTGFRSLKSMGLTPAASSDGSFRIVATDPGKAAERREGLAAFNRAFSEHMCQAACDAFEPGSAARGLASRTCITGHSVTRAIPRIRMAAAVTDTGEEVDVPVSGDELLMMVQPSVEFRMNAHAASVTRNVLCATGAGGRSPEDVYGREALDNADRIRSYFDDGGWNGGGFGHDDDSRGDDGWQRQAEKVPDLGRADGGSEGKGSSWRARLHMMAEMERRQDERRGPDPDEFGGPEL